MKITKIPLAVLLLSLSSFLLGPVAALALGMSVVIEGKTVTFVDIPQSAWYATYVRAAAEAGIVSGYKNAQGNPTGEFGPGNRITIAEALKIAIEGAGYDSDAYGRVVASGVGNHWASNYVSVAKEENFAIVQGTLQLDRPATRAEVASIFTSAFLVNIDVSPTDSRFSDVDTSMKDAASIEALSRDAVISGDTDIYGTSLGTFRPNDAINRAEVAKIVMRAREKYAMPGQERLPENSEREAEGNMVFYTAEGFSPSVIRNKKGESVQFKNETTNSMWVASDPHPIHTEHPSLEASHAYLQGEVYTHVFTQVGTWTYHNHAYPNATGTVIVE